MSLTLDQLRARVRADYPREDWHNQCAGWAYYVCRVTGTVSRVYGTATDAYNASTIVSTDPAKAPAGAFHFWSYWTTLNGRRDDYGHVALASGHGRAVMTDPEDDEATWGINLGETDVARWTARRRGIVRYLGWSRTYGANTARITPPAPAPAGRPTPTPVLPEEEEDMALKIIVSPKGNSDAAKYFYDPDKGELTRPVNGAAESAVLREVARARPEAVVFVEVDAKHIAELK